MKVHGIVEHLPSSRKPYIAPRPIQADDRFQDFDCGRKPLDDFLKRRALKNEGKASRTYVLCSAVGENAGAVVGFYTLSAGAVTAEEAPGWAKRNMPNPLPVLVLGRLAVDERHKGKQLGKALLRDALQRSLQASRSVGARAVIVNAIDDEAVTFYTRYGFQIFPNGSRTLFLPIETIARGL